MAISSYEEWHGLLRYWRAAACEVMECPYGHPECPGWLVSSAGIVPCSLDSRSGVDLSKRVIEKMDEVGRLPLGMCGERCITCFLILDHIGASAVNALSEDSRKVHEMIARLLNDNF